MLEKAEGYGAGSMETAAYTWLADGTKAQVIDQDDNGYVYLGSLIYKQLPDGSLELESTNHGSGRIVVKDNPTTPGEKFYENQYHITDHLGSVRTVFNQNGEVLARNDFYPFGKQHNNPTLTANLPNSANPQTNRFLFNGKEKQLTGNLNLMDYGWRMHDPEIGRWFGVDLKSEEYYTLSPYVFSGNNPIRYIDPNGMEISKAAWDQFLLFVDEIERNEDKNTVPKYFNDNGEFVYETEDGSGNTTFAADANISLGNGPTDNPGGDSSEESSKAHNYVSLAAESAAEGMTWSYGTYKLQNSKGQFRPSYYKSGWAGNQWVKTSSVAKLGKGLGWAIGAISVVSDAIGVYNYLYNPSADHVTEPFDLGVTAAAVLSGPAGIGIGVVDAVYPGGFKQAMVDRAELESERRKSMGRMYLPVSTKSYW